MNSNICLFHASMAIQNPSQPTLPGTLAMGYARLNSRPQTLCNGRSGLDSLTHFRRMLHSGSIQIPMSWMA